MLELGHSVEQGERVRRGQSNERIAVLKGRVGGGSRRDVDSGLTDGALGGELDLAVAANMLTVLERQLEHDGDGWRRVGHDGAEADGGDATDSAAADPDRRAYADRRRAIEDRDDGVPLDEGGFDVGSKEAEGEDRNDAGEQAEAREDAAALWLVHDGVIKFKVMLRIGHIDYSNCIPVHAALLHEPPPGVEVVHGTPAELNRALAAGQIDVAPCSSIEFALHAEEYRLLPGLVIGSNGPVKSILLEITRDFSNLSGAPVAVPTASATSVVLLRILLQIRFGVQPRFEWFDQ